MKKPLKYIRAANKRRKQREEGLKRELEEIQSQRIPEPAYIFNVGDRVVYGAYDYSEVLEVYENGKYYRLHSCTISRNTNRGDRWSEKEHYEMWFKLGFYRTKEELQAIDRVEEDDDIFFSYTQTTMKYLLRMMHSQYGIDLEPEYQRGNVWNKKQKYDLIDSIYKNIDIGKFTVIRRPWGNNPNKPDTPLLYEMLDGKQRLTAIWDFYTGRFPYKGKYFYELHPRDQGHLKEYSISYAETAPITNEQKYRYFLKLNTTGTPVSKEHLEYVKELWEYEKSE